MQIHELQEYSGVPGSGSVLAIDDGTNTRKIVPTNLGIQTEMTQAEAESGTSTAKRILTPKVFHDSVLSIVNSSSQGRVWYGTCPTAAGGTGANPKIVTVEDGFTLTAGATIAVKFDNASGGLGYGRDLNVNGTGAVPINVRGMTGTLEYEPWSAGEVVVFVYDGTYWQMVSPSTGKRTNIASRVTATRTGGASSSSTVTVLGSTRIGNMVNTNIRVDAGAAVAAGSNIITFTLNTCDLWTGASFAGSYNGAVPVFALKPSGTDCTVSVRALGAVTASMYFTLYFTYQIED